MHKYLQEVLVHELVDDVRAGRVEERVEGHGEAVVEGAMLPVCAPAELRVLQCPRQRPQAAKFESQPRSKPQTEGQSARYRRWLQTTPGPRGRGTLSSCGRESSTTLSSVHTQFIEK